MRKFHEASLRGDYFERFDVNGNNCADHSKGTDAFIAEFDRLTGRCPERVAEGSYETARGAFKLLFALLRHIDEPLIASSSSPTKQARGRCLSIGTLCSQSTVDVLLKVVRARILLAKLTA